MGQRIPEAFNVGTLNARDRLVSEPPLNNSTNRSRGHGLEGGNGLYANVIRNSLRFLRLSKYQSKAGIRLASSSKHDRAVLQISQLGQRLIAQLDGGGKTVFHLMHHAPSLRHEAADRIRHERANRKAVGFLEAVPQCELHNPGFGQSAAEDSE